MHDADVGHGGFGKNAGHITGLQGFLKSRDVVELDNFGRE
jgi:hypothetical protein